MGKFYYNTLSDNRMAASRRFDGIIGSRALLRKPMPVVLEEVTQDKLERHLTLFDLVVIGVAGTIGSGMFALVGLIASSYAGPAGVISWTLAGLGCMLSGLSYAELSSMIPSEGGAYAYAYVALGELPAMLTGWLLTLEFGVAGAAVARNWADKVLALLVQGGTLGGTGGSVRGVWNMILDPFPELGWSPLAGLLQAVCVVVFLRGVSVGKRLTTVLTVIKMAVCAFIIIMGFSLFNVENLTPFAPFGAVGIVRGTSAAYFGYLGYDEVCTLAGECLQPRRDLPRTIGITLALVSTTYVLGTIVLSGMLPSSLLDPDAAFALGFSDRGLRWAGQVVAVGELVSLPAVVLVSFMAQPRVLFALASDGLLPASLSRTDGSGVLRKGTILSGVVCTLMAVCAPFASLEDMISVGVLLIFNITNSCAIVVRRSDLDPSNPTSCQTLVLAYNALCLVTGLLTRVFFEVEGEGWWSVMMLIALGVGGGLAIAGALASVVAVASQPSQQPEGGGEVFLAPLSPWLPALGILSGWMLVGQLSWASLCASLWALCMVVVWYWVYGIKHSVGQKSRTWQLSAGLSAARAFSGTYERGLTSQSSFWDSPRGYQTLVKHQKREESVNFYS